jgi:hypothetical protein
VHDQEQLRSAGVVRRRTWLQRRLAQTDQLRHGFNSAGHGGGVTALNESAIDLINCLITENDAIGPSTGQLQQGSGGGVVVTSVSSIEIVNCTITANTSVSLGGGYAEVANADSIGSSIEGSILWNNQAGPDGDEIHTDLNASSLAVRYSNVRDRNGTGVEGPVGIGCSPACWS